MRRRIIALWGAIGLATTAGAQATTHGDDGAPDDLGIGKIAVRDVEGDRVGTVWLRQRDGVVWVSARFRALTPGFHGFHVHQTGVCDPAAAGGPFTTAGGHYALGDTTHGDHAGDLPSLLVGEDGKAQLTFATDRFTLAELRDADGSAVMIHEGRDNFANIPERYSTDGVTGPDATTLGTGDAGTRTACGVIEPRDHEPRVERVNVLDVQGDRVGTVWLRQRDGVVWVSARFRALTPGFHGFHVHQTGVCDPAAAGGPFTTAGGHYALGDTTHGDHAGDLPSLLVGEDGKAQLTFATDRFTLAELRDADGSAVMIHEGRDNFANIPERYSADGVTGPDATTLGTGDAGTRTACGVMDASHRH